MGSIHPDRRGGLRAVLPIALILCLLAGALTPASAQFGEADPADEHEGEALVLDSVGDWQTDDQGQEFRIVKLDKRNRQEGLHYVRIDEKTIRGAFGIPIEFFREDDDFFWVREAKPVILVPTAAEPAAEPTSPNEDPLPPALWRIEFASRSQGLPNQAQWRNGFLFADMNGDGRLDLVHGPPRKASSVPHIYLQREDGSWRRWGIELPPVPLDYGDIEVADFNGDGHPDLALAMHIRGGMVLLGDGEGRFRRASEGISYREDLNDPAWTGRTVAAADLDGDGDTDLVYLGEGMEPPGLREKGTRPMSGASGVMIYLNQAKAGDATPRWQELPLRARAFGDSIEVGDIDNDGVPEIAHANKVVRGKAVLWKYHEESASWQIEDLDIPQPASTSAVAFAQIDGAPGDELITAGISRVGGVIRQTVHWHQRLPDGTWKAHEVFSRHRLGTSYAVAAGDLDGDGKTDIVVGTDEAELLMFRGMGEGRFEFIDNNLTERTVVCGARFIRLQDLDGDGRDELTVSFAGESSTIAGVGTFPGCENEGSIRVWSPLKIEAIDPASVAADPSG